MRSPIRERTRTLERSKQPKKESSRSCEYKEGGDFVFGLAEPEVERRHRTERNQGVGQSKDLHEICVTEVKKFRSLDSSSSRVDKSTK